MWAHTLVALPGHMHPAGCRKLPRRRQGAGQAATAAAASRYPFSLSIGRAELPKGTG